MNVAPNGTVHGYSNEQEFTGRRDTDRLHVANRTWRVSRDGDGLVLREDKNEQHRVALWRTW